MEILMAIATLCQVSAGAASYRIISDAQTECQKSYIACIEKKGETASVNDFSSRRALIQCVKEH